MITYFNCNLCGHAIEADCSKAGVSVKCASCGKAVMVPIRSPKQACSKRSQSQKSQWSPTDAGMPALSHASSVQGLDPESATQAFGDPALTQRQPASAPANSVLAKFVVGYLAGGILAAIYFGFNSLSVTKAIAELGATVVRAEGKNESKVAPVAIQEQAKPVEKKDIAARRRLLARASLMVEMIQAIDASVQKEATYDPYMRSVVDLQAAVDETLAMAEEAGVSPTDAEIQQLYKIAVVIVQDHCEAVKLWKQENSLVTERKEVRAAHDEKIRTATDMAAINQSLQETTKKLDQLSAQLMATIEARYDLWIDAQKQTKTAVEILTQLKQSDLPR